MNANLKQWICVASLCLISSAASATTPMVSAGNQFALALKAGGTISALGRNDYGQLGNGQAAMRVAPAKVEGLAGVAAVVAGDGMTLALQDDGTLWAWDNPKSAWYFYAPSLEAQGGTALSGYITNKGYLDFGAANKKLGNGTGFWVNR